MMACLAPPAQNTPRISGNYASALSQFQDYDFRCSKYLLCHHHLQVFLAHSVAALEVVSSPTRLVVILLGVILSVSEEVEEAREEGKYSWSLTLASSGSVHSCV